MLDVPASCALLAWTVALRGVAIRAMHAIGDAPPRDWTCVLPCVPIVAWAAGAAPSVATLPRAAACIGLVVGGLADARTGYLFDAVTAPVALVTTALAVAAGHSAEATWGIALLVGTFGAAYVLSRGRAIGLGDVKALIAVGAGFGAWPSLVALFAASVSAIAFSLLRAPVRHREIRFGPHLAIGAAVALVVADPVVHGLVGR